MESERTRKINSLVIKEETLIKAFNLNPFVSIPYGVRILRSECFFCQTSIKEAVMADSVVSIEDSAFEGCARMHSIVMSPNVEHIGRSAFADCVALRTVTLPRNLIHLGFGAFNGCKNLSEIRLFPTLEAIDGAAFVYTRIHTVYFEGNVTDWLRIRFSNLHSNPLSRGATLWFGNDKVRDLVIPAETEEIGNYAFVGCGSLRSLEIKEGTQYIGAYAFARCSQLKRVFLPKSVKKVGRAAFAGAEDIHITLSEHLFEDLKAKRCPVCQEKLPFFEYKCKKCGAEFHVYGD